MARIEALSFLTTTTPVKATGTITFTGPAASLSTSVITIDDGVNGPIGFRITNGGPLPGEVNVPVAATAATAATNLKTAIEASVVGRYISVTDDGEGELTLTHRIPGSVGNVTITEDGDTDEEIAVTGLSGGVDAVVEISFMKDHASALTQS